MRMKRSLVFALLSLSILIDSVVSAKTTGQSSRLESSLSEDRQPSLSPLR